MGKQVSSTYFSNSLKRLFTVFGRQNKEIATSQTQMKQNPHVSPVMRNVDMKAHVDDKHVSLQITAYVVHLVVSFFLLFLFAEQIAAATRFPAGEVTIV